MLLRFVSFALLFVFSGCGQKEPARANPSKGSEVAPPVPATSDKAALPELSANAPTDKPVAVNGKEAAEERERAVAPYIAQGRRTYPDAKKRYLAGLGPDHHFYVMAR